ncbi:DUF4166 domain-containing protein [Myxococcus sp. CA040A]|uniref:DUF4166 domain-containing protein n=1 Tax=Myxococcus sp. CA040A TaxID=2741738 RepID=UPI00157B59B9|nr:DUF4166 domain-containing protein [Myxococcus sp. CA040A]NTX05904.1 hypothetical protein [Myxococcus sp. CA040A]
MSAEAVETHPRRKPPRTRFETRVENTVFQLNSMASPHQDARLKALLRSEGSPLADAQLEALRRSGELHPGDSQLEALLPMDAKREARLHPEELDEARTALPDAPLGELRDFAIRHRACRLSLSLLADFYRAHPCRMAKVHLLAASAVTLGRFWGVSEPFARLGAAVMPVDERGFPRTREWASYARACEDQLPLEVRDERWIEAHMRDVARARDVGYEAAFLEEARVHGHEPLWRLLVQHVEMTLGARLFDQPALAGAVPGETAIAHGLALSLSRMLSASWSLLRHYAFATVRALCLPRWRHDTGLVDERRTAWLLLTSFITAWTAASVYRRGVKAVHRGQRARPSDVWPLLATVLGPDMSRVDPRVMRFYANPGAWGARASVTFASRTARLLAWMATRLSGQGLSEHGARTFPGRFLTFRRADGSMHFVRELYCDGVLRRFDSDFILRDGRLHEVFVEHGLDLELDVSVLEDGGIRLRGGTLRWHGLVLPPFGRGVEFRIHPVSDATERVDIIGTFGGGPTAGAPLGRIHYEAWRHSDAVPPVTTD